MGETKDEGRPGVAGLAALKPGTVFIGMNGRGQEVISTKKLGEWFDSGNKILRLATPEEIAGTEKKMCPAGCGARYGTKAHNGMGQCAWCEAYVKAQYEGERSLENYADAHWKEFLPKPGIHLTPESVGKAYRNGFTKVTVETRREGVYCVRGAYNHAGQAYLVKEDGKLADRCEAWAATFHNVKDKDLDLISEWDEKAEAGGSADTESRLNRKVQAPEAVQPQDAPGRNAPPAQPEILPTWTDGDIDAFMAKRGANLEAAKCIKRNYVAAVLEGRIKEPEPYQPDAPDRRAEHVPVAKSWVNPAMLGR